MHLVVVMMLGICVPSIATGFAEVDDVAEPVRAGTVSSHTQDGAEAEAADAASKGASPPPAPAKATGELTDGERLFQGVWQLHSYESDIRTGTLRIDDRDFRADTVHGSYVGYVSIRSDKSPAQVDFTIEGCECKFDGMTSTAIYYEDDGTIVFAAPAPGEPRPKAFTGLDVTRVMLERATRPVEGDGEKPR
jgi:hypothetical protein